MKRNNAEKFNELESEKEKIAALNLSDIDEEPDENHAFQTTPSLITQYFNISESVLFEDVPNNVKSLKIYLAGETDVNQGTDDLNENCSDRIEEKEKYLYSHKIYCSQKVYTHSKTKVAVLPSGDTNHSDFKELLQMNFRNQDIENECSSNASNCDRILSSGELVNNEGSNCELSSSIENKISSISISALCSTSPIKNKKSIALSLKELSHNFKFGSPATENTISSDNSLENLSHQLNCSSESKICDVSTPPRNVSKTKKPISLGLEAKIKKSLKCESPSPSTKNLSEEKKVGNLHNEPSCSSKNTIFDMGTASKTKKSVKSSCKGRGKKNLESESLLNNSLFDDNTLKNDTKKTSKNSVNKTSIKKCDSYEKNKSAKQLRVSLTDILCNTEEFKKVKNQNDFIFVDSITATMSNGCVENSVNSEVNERDKNFVSESFNHKLKTKGIRTKTCKKDKEKLSVEENVCQSIDENKKNCPLQSETLAISVNKLDSCQDANNITFTKNLQLVNSGKMNMLKTSVDMLMKTAKQTVPVKNETISRKTVHLLNYNIVNESAKKKTVNSIQRISNKSANLDSTVISVNGITDTATEELETINKNTKQKVKSESILHHIKTNKKELKNPEINDLEVTDTFDKDNSTATPVQKQSTFMKLFSKFAENGSNHETKMFSVQQNLMNLLTGSCKMDQKERQTKDKTFQNLEVVRGKKANTEIADFKLSETDAEISSSCLEMCDHRQNKASLDKSTGESVASKSPSVDPILIFPHSPSICTNKKSPEKNQKMCKNSEENIKNKSTLKRKKNYPLPSGILNEVKESVLSSIEADEKDDDTVIGQLISSDTNNDIDPPFIEKPKIGQKKRSLVKSRPKTSVLLTPCSQLSNVCTNNRSKKKQRLYPDSEESIYNKSPKRRKNDNSLSLDASPYLSTMKGLEDDSFVDMSNMEDVESKSNLLETHDIDLPITGTLKTGRKKKTLVKNKAKCKVSKLSSFSSSSPRSCKLNGTASKTELKVCKNSEESIDNSSILKKQQSINSLPFVASSNLLSSEESDDSLFIKIPKSRKDARTICATPSSKKKPVTVCENSTLCESSKKNFAVLKKDSSNSGLYDDSFVNMSNKEDIASKSNLLETHDTDLPITGIAGRKKKTVKNKAKCKVSKLSSFSSSYPRSCKLNGTASKTELKICKNSEESIDNKPILKKQQRINLLPFVTTSDLLSSEESDDSLSLKTPKSGKDTRTICATPSSKKKPVTMCEYSTLSESSKKDFAVLKKDSINSKQNASNFTSVKRRRCNSTHAISAYNSCITQTEETPMNGTKPNSLRHDTVKGSTKKERNKRSSSLEPSLQILINTPKCKRETSNRKSTVEFSPRKSQRLRSRSRRLSQSSVSLNVQNKTFGSSSNLTNYTTESMDQNARSKNVPIHNLSKNHNAYSSVPIQNTTVNNIPHDLFNQVIPVNIPVYYHPASNSFILSNPFIQCPQMANPIVVSNGNPINSLPQLSQLPLPIQNAPNVVIAPPRTHPNVVTYPVFQPRVLPQPSNFQFNNLISTKFNAVSGHARNSNSVNANNKSLFGLISNNLNAVQPAEVRSNVPNGTSSSNVAPMNVRQTVVVNNNTNWPTCGNTKLPTITSNYPNQNIQPSAIKCYQNQKLEPVVISYHKNLNPDLRDIVDGTVNWKNVMQNIGTFICKLRMSHFAKMVYCAFDLSDNMTVKEYFSYQENIDVISKLVIKKCSASHTSHGLRYNFHYTFPENSMREILKDYVSFYLTHVFQITDMTELVDRVYQTFTVEDSMYFSALLPKELQKEINVENIIMYFTVVSLLRVYDEYKKWQKGES